MFIILRAVVYVIRLWPRCLGIGYIWSQLIFVCNSERIIKIV